MRRPLTITLTLMLTAGALSGCARKHHEIAYEPARGMENLAPGLAAPENGFMLLADQQTDGRFACGLAVAKLIPCEDPQSSGLLLVPMHPNEEACWTEQLRGVDAVRDLEFIRPLSTRPEGQSTADLCQAARRVQATLLLVYAPSRPSANSAQVVGVLYDSATEQALATLRASSRILDEHAEEVAPDHKRGDQRGNDARYQAQHAFEAHALACLRELIHRDSQPTTTQPHRWQQPFIERWWQHYR